MTHSRPSCTTPADARGATRPRDARAVQRAARALTDAGLVAAMRSGDVGAWAEFEARFRPLCETYARRVRIARDRWPLCIDEVLEDEAMRLVEPDVSLPTCLGAYLVRAVYHRHLRMQRAAARRAARYAAASEAAADGSPASAGGERVVRVLCSEAALRASAGPAAEFEGRERADDDAVLARALARLARSLAAQLTPDERLVLTWVAEGVPRRQIAAWLGANYEVTRKRILRLTARLRAAAERHVATFPPDEQRAVAHLVDPVAPRGAAPGVPPTPARPAALSAAARPTSGVPSHATAP